MAGVWFYESNGTYSGGPLTTEELASALSRLATPGKVKVWRAGLDGWAEAERVAELRGVLGALPRQQAPSDADIIRRDATEGASRTTVTGARTAAPGQKQAPKNPRTPLLWDENHQRVTADLRVFFGPRPDPYINVFEDMRLKQSLSVIRLSWPALLFSFVWFFYRKMYVVGAIAILVPIVVALLFPGVALTGAYIGLSMAARPTYVQSALKRISKADALGLAGSERVEYLRRAGGVSLAAGILAGVLYALLLALIVYVNFVKP